MRAQNESPITLFFAASIFVALVIWIFWQDKRAVKILQAWARKNGYQLISYEVRIIARGGFWWRTSKNQNVFRIDVVDVKGDHHTGFVRVGGWLLGILDDDSVTVEWDKLDPLHGPHGFPVILPKLKDQNNDARPG